MRDLLQAAGFKLQAWKDKRQETTDNRIQIFCALQLLRVFA
jgi:hypothetical protein